MKGKKRAKEHVIGIATGYHIFDWFVLMPYLGSERFAECRTRPQYVDRSYWDAGRSREPGSDEVIFVILRADHSSFWLPERRIQWLSYNLQSVFL